MFEPASKSLPAIDYVSMVRAVYGDRRATLVASLSSAIAAGAAAYKTGHWALWAIAGVFVATGSPVEGRKRGACTPGWLPVERRP